MPLQWRHYLVFQAGIIISHRMGASVAERIKRCNQRLIRVPLISPHSGLELRSLVWKAESSWTCLWGSFRWLTDGRRFSLSTTPRWFISFCYSHRKGLHSCIWAKQASETNQPHLLTTSNRTTIFLIVSSTRIDIHHVIVTQWNSFPLKTFRITNNSIITSGVCVKVEIWLGDEILAPVVLHIHDSHVSSHCRCNN